MGEGTETSFIARFWIEREPGGSGRWRGHVRHVQGAGETYFSELGTLVRFLETSGRVRWPRGSLEPAEPKAADRGTSGERPNGSPGGGTP